MNCKDSDNPKKNNNCMQYKRTTKDEKIHVYTY